MKMSSLLPRQGFGFTDGVLPEKCSSRIVLDHVTSKWGVLTLIALSESSLRWGELRRVVQGISEKMLAQTLRTLEADGIVHREAQASIPPRVDYSLTERGTEVVERLLPLMGWISANADDIVGGGAGAGRGVDGGAGGGGSSDPAGAGVDTGAEASAKAGGPGDTRPAAVENAVAARREPAQI
jgi:DNA-binding HxlR family transcriptional regulator